GNHRLARAALTTGAASLAASPVLLTADLGRPERFHHMLRVFRPTSPMNLGSWLLAAISPALLGAAVADRLGITPRLARTAEGVAAVLGPGLATYTAVLLADTAVPVWHEAGRELPFVFAGSAAAAAGGAAAILTPPAEAGPARRLAVAGALVELGAAEVMQRRLGELAEPYGKEPARRYARLARACGGAGAAVLALAGRRRPAAVLGGALLLAGSACQRLAVHKAGIESARDPKYVVKQQRERLEANGGPPPRG
ncbi:MAG TPA: NrfD/PsrC family molybdoenzyme membrane anchor subunit, partial [Actinomycetota bacterium]|nr:NrfD/PsrC family molybdoenzyme membrane anchor subunit [Actinomycetota bacterium]